MARRHSGCPLCGATVTPPEWIRACSELVHPDFGVLSACCPYCQGEIELRACTGRVELGYFSAEIPPRFQVALSLPYDGLVVEASAATRSLVLVSPHGRWVFNA